MEDNAKQQLLNPSLLPASSTSSQGPSATQWVEICAEDEVSVEGIYSYEIERYERAYPIILVRTSGGLYALHDECPHRRTMLSSEGYLEGEVIHCGWHHWGFSLETGAHTLPTQICVERFDVSVEEGQVWISVPQSPAVTC